VKGGLTRLEGSTHNVLSQQTDFLSLQVIHSMEQTQKPKNANAQMFKHVFFPTDVIKNSKYTSVRICPYVPSLFKNNCV
jgi:hypothetical protein